MANALYDKAREKFLAGLLSWLTDDIKAVLVKIGGGNYNFSAAHEFLSPSVAIADRIETSGLLVAKTAFAGVADADDVTFLTVTGPQSGAIIIYHDTGLDATASLIAYIDTATGLPVTPSGGDITVQFDAGVNKIFKL